MTWIRPIEKLSADDVPAAGGKGAALARLQARRIPIPRTLVLTTRAYRDFVAHGGLAEKIQLELNRKPFSQMRWEELWDASQRLRLLFLKSPLPPGMASEIGRAITAHFSGRMMVVRSSAPQEDRRGHSFAGVHASFTHLADTNAVIRHVQRVWASLWSDAALLYRQELGLDSAGSSMAVLIQEMVAGQVSGILFTQDPVTADRGVIETVHGMNPPLVDGRIAPDRWSIDPDTGAVIEHIAPASRDRWQTNAGGGDNLVPLPAALQDRPPLAAAQIAHLWAVATRIVDLTGCPQDIEWTLDDGRLVVLQARPITTASQPANDKRSWYLSLHRSLDNLLQLRERIETDLIPRMRSTADELADIALNDFDDIQLAGEIRRRWEINQYWVGVYWEDFIPFAHGMRLFGQVYNEMMTPDDPYRFMELLKHQDLLSLERNRSLAELAAELRKRPDCMAGLESGDLGRLDPAFTRRLNAFVQRYGDLSCPVTGAVGCQPDASILAHLLVEMARMPVAHADASRATSIDEQEADFLNACPPEVVADCRQLLSLARSSYRLRDDDNIILGAIEAQLITAVQEGRRRVDAGSQPISTVLAELGLDAGGPSPARQDEPPPVIHDRQITGQPAGPGLVRGTARVIREHADIARFKRGEVIVCDGVDPNMTFVMPLAAGIVERRGGMLIHGAIIAREYGLPCVTGVHDATSRIRTGQTVTVDGYLGIVTVGHGGAH
jgi:pyruvate,water dikinase